MNNIKYRQWLKYGRFHYWGYLKDDVFVAPCGPNDAAAPSEKFTGLYDKNGVEIYEGDVFEHPDTLRFVVVYDNYLCAFRAQYFGSLSKDGATYSIPLQLSDKGGAILIGNIHENPELVEANHDHC